MGPRVMMAACVLGLVAVGGCSHRPATPPGFQGLVEYDQRVIGFEVGGRVIDVAVHRGQRVHEGDVLARLDDGLAIASRDARQAELDEATADLNVLRAGTRREDVASAAADLRAAEANEALLRREAGRERSLAADGAVPGADADRAQSAFEEADARRRSAQSRLASLQRGARPEEIVRAEAKVRGRAAALSEESQRLERYILRAQGPGTILDVTIKPGEVAAPGTPAVTIADVSHPYADVFVPEGQVGSVQVGAAATAHVDSVSSPLPASVDYISPETEFTPKFLFSGSERPNLVVRMRVRIDDPQRLLHSGVPVFAEVAR